MRHLVIIAVLFFAAVAGAEVNQGIGVLGFQAWKASRLEDAQKQVAKAQSEAPSAAKPEVKPAKSPQESARLQKGSRSDQRLQQAQLNVEIAQELGVNDYFVLYLNQFKDRSAFLEAAQKLNASEAADLMMAYQKHLASSVASEATLPSLPVSRTPVEANTAQR